MFGSHIKSYKRRKRTAWRRGSG